MGVEDTFGNAYTDNYEKLTYVFPGQITLNVNLNTKFIYGEGQNKNAFYSCRGIENVIFPIGSKLQIIENYAFYRCISLKSINLDVCTELSSINDFAFYETESLNTIEFPQSLKSLKGKAFYRSGLSGVITIPNKVTYLGVNLFSSCVSLQEVQFQDGINLKTLPESCFSRTGLVRISIPPSVTTINGFALHGNPKLQSIKADNSNYFKIENGMLLDKNGLKMYACPAAYSTENVTLPDTVTEIITCGFHSCKAKKIILSDKLKKIGAHAFRETVIENLEMPDSVTYCAENVFDGCGNLKTVKLSNQLTSITNYMFTGSGIESITIPESVTSLGINCFQNCKNLGNVILPKQITVFGGGAFSGCIKLNLSFAEGSPFEIDKQFLITSKGLTVVSQYIGPNPGATVKIPKTIKTIDSSSFSLNTNIEHITFEENSVLESIEYRAFFQCSKLKTFEFPQSLLQIKESAFQETELQNIVFGNKINLIGLRAFGFCNSLISVEFAATTQGITFSRNVFQFCTKIETFIFPDGLTYISASFLMEAFALKTVVLPASLTEIQTKAFYNSGLTSVTFKGAVNLLEIGDFAFSQSESLTDFQFVDGIKSIGIYAFANTNISQIVLPRSIEVLSERCFSDCHNLVTAKLAIKEEPSRLQTLGDAIFQGSNNLSTIVCENEYFTTKNGALYNKDLTTIFAFPPASNAHFIYLPAELKYISSGTFHSCISLYSVLITDDSGLEQIGSYAFANCVELRSINIPISVTKISTNAFENCKMLSCGLVISNTTKEYRDNLVQVAKMPKRCLNKCNDCPSVVRALTSPMRFSHLIFACLFTINC